MAESGESIAAPACPVCGCQMRLVMALPEEDHRERMVFRCACGFDYQQSASVAVERMLWLKNAFTPKKKQGIG